jgi:DNA-binding response OmpR family regulator
VTLLQGARVLVIDDDALVRAALSRQLRKLGCVPELAASGREGVALAGAQAFDAAIVDLNMPEMGGTETIDQIRKLSSVPVIMISAALNLRSTTLDSVARLPKPFALHELQAALEAAMAVRRS